MKIGDRVQTIKPVAAPGWTLADGPAPHIVGEITELEEADGRQLLTVFADAGGVWYFTDDEVQLSEPVTRG